MLKAIAIHYGHNCTVGFSIDGEILCLLSEERLCRKKNATGYPFQALQYVIDNYLEGDINNVDKVAIVDGSGLGAAYLLRHGIEPQRYLDYYWKRKSLLWTRLVSPSYRVLKTISQKLRPLILKKIKLRGVREDILKKVGLDPRKVSFYDHHACHAASSAYFSPVINEEPWLILTLDGEGDGLSSTVSIFNGESFEKISSNLNSVSLGYLFAETTSYLGMKSNEHEFKLMGMAPYADPDQVERLTVELSSLIRVSSDGQFNTSVSAFDFLPQLMRIYAFERFDVISGAIQKLTEDLICQWAEYWIKKTGIARVALSGGVFMNVKAAKKLSESKFVESIFVVPSASDESLPIGALWMLAHDHDVEVKPVTDIYLGRGFGRDYVEEMIVRDKLEEDFDIEHFDSDHDLAERVASLLASNEIVARCCGREEWGARSLGNRSIMCNPSSFQNIERLNSKIKCRDFWMPFTPSLLAEDMQRYVVNPRNTFAPYMSITFETTSLAREHFAAAVHPRDFTMRPQAVVESWNADYYRIISKFRDKTGIGGVLNTSFNLHGEPNVSTPEDAIRTVRGSGLDYVVIEHVLFHKKI
jgi:carbamoyltransferase